MAAHIEQDSQFFTRRGVVVGAILLLHLFILWALVTGLASRAIEALAPPVQAVFQPEDVKNTPPPPPPPPTFERPPVEIPPTDTIVEVPQAVATTAISNTTTPARGRAGGRQGGERHQAAQDRGKRLPAHRRLLPARFQASRGAGRSSGARVHVRPGWQLARAPRRSRPAPAVARLDEGALDLVKAGAKDISPGTEDGKPIDSCFDFRVKFQMSK